MDATITVEEVEQTETRSGNTRWIVRDQDGREYTTFRPRIGEEATPHKGRRARIEFHEVERNGFHNVYLDAIQAAPAAPEEEQPAADSDPDEIGWKTAVEAAPWLVGSAKATPPDVLFDKLEPFKRRVSEDIRHRGDGD